MQTMLGILRDGASVVLNASITEFTVDLRFGQVRQRRRMAASGVGEQNVEMAMGDPADMGLPGFAVYASTNAAVRSLARSWTTDLKTRDIRVNSISPGVVPTEGYGVEQKMSAADVAAYVERVSKEITAGRVGTAQDIGDALVFLASDVSRYIRGIDLVVDGGMTRVYAGRN
jgi:NAD(P)-dependent dehydrogenase (short-subunit alcohol dehydrogenase family)